MSGTATLRDKNTIEVSGPEGNVTITADHIILATGSRPITVPGFTVDNQRIHDSTGAQLSIGSASPDGDWRRLHRS